MTPETVSLVRELAGPVCQCGRGKERSMTFCRTCFMWLPMYLRKSLYAPIGRGYGEAYSRAVEYLRTRKEALALHKSHTNRGNVHASGD